MLSRSKRFIRFLSTALGKERLETEKANCAEKAQFASTDL